MGSLKQGFLKLKEEAGELLLSSEEEYKGMLYPLRFKCKECNNEIVSVPMFYIRCKDRKYCNACKRKKTVDSADSKQVFINECEKKHGKYYDYSLLPEHFKMKEEIPIICPEHGEVRVQAFIHKKGSGCGKCKGKRISEAKRQPTSEFIRRANERYGF